MLYIVKGFKDGHWINLSQHTNLTDAEIQKAAYEDFHGEPGTEIASEYTIEIIDV